MAADLPERLSAVMSVLHLIFNEGYAAAQGTELLRRGLSTETIELARLLRALLHARLGSILPEVDSLLALMLLHDARRETRVAENGESVLLEEQDRNRWGRAEIEEGCALVHAALARARPGMYALEAAIAAVHAESPSAQTTDWSQIAGLYARLLELYPSPVVALNRTVAVARAEGYAVGLELVDALEQALSGYHLWHAARADLLRRPNRRTDAIASYRRALEVSQNASGSRFLARRLAELGAPVTTMPRTV